MISPFLSMLASILPTKDVLEATYALKYTEGCVGLSVPLNGCTLICPATFGTCTVTGASDGSDFSVSPWCPNAFAHRSGRWVGGCTVEKSGTAKRITAFSGRQVSSIR